jgi:hypothetical protein
LSRIAEAASKSLVGTAHQHVPGDRILGAPDGGLRLCPESWLYWVRVDLDGLRSLLGPLLELPIERVVVSHGEPVLQDGHGALRRCLSSRDS